VRECCSTTGWKEQDGYIESSGQIWPARPGEQQYEWEPPRLSNIRSGRSGEGGNKANEVQKPGTAGASREMELGQQEPGRIEPTVGRDTNGNPGGVDYAGLCVSCDNRTDELRLLGNGVVPIVAGNAYSVLNQR